MLCLLHAHASWRVPADIDTRARAQSHIQCDATITCDPVLALCTLHMLCRGEPPFLRLRPRPDAPDAAAAFEAAFERLRPGAGKADRRSCGLPLKSLRENDSDTDVVLVPMYDLQHRRNVATGRWAVEREMCFWCYRVAPGSVFAAISWITAARMPVVWDLDDTLVVANGEGALRDKRDKARPPKKRNKQEKNQQLFARAPSCLQPTRRTALCQLLSPRLANLILRASLYEVARLRGVAADGAGRNHCALVQAQQAVARLTAQLENEAMSPEVRGATERDLGIASAQFDLVDTDARMLREYMQTDAVTDAAGRTHAARLETAFCSVTDLEATLARPVVRITKEGEDFETIFTRVDPASAGTSMIIRIRAGWELLKAELTATVGGAAGEGRGALRWDSYVCTAAEQPYALEVRLALWLGGFGVFECFCYGAWLVRFAGCSQSSGTALAGCAAMSCLVSGVRSLRWRRVEGQGPARRS